MQISNRLPQFTKTKALVAVMAKEEGVIYLAADGRFEILSHVIEPHSTYSDREGFFFRSKRGTYYGSGAPYEANEEDVKKFISKFSDAINRAIARYNPDVIYLLRPSYLKGRLNSGLKNPTHVPLRVVKEGNYVQKSPREILEYVHQYENTVADYGEPDSVGNEVNAEEKRKILAIGR